LEENKNISFSDLGLSEMVLEGISTMGYSKPTAIQEKAIPAIIQGKDLIASAQTGTGKTGAFLLPLIHEIIEDGHDGHIRALVIVPTRELAIQIDQQMEGMSYFTHVNSIAVYGGSDGAMFMKEKAALSKGADVVISTPGRLIAHLNLGYIDWSTLRYLVLDEADRMLDMGFYDDIMRIISHLPKKRQNLLFSATMPPKIRDLAKKVLSDPEEISIALSKPPEKITQAAFVVYEAQKIPLVTYLLSAKKLNSVLVFCSTKVGAKQLSQALKKQKLNVEEIHSDLEQKERKEVLNRFRSRKTTILVATDVLSRGIDIDNIDMVVNYDVPKEGEDYIHRIGRTARAESKGMAVTLVSENDQRSFAAIEKLLGREVKKPSLPAQFGNAPDYNPSAHSFARKGRFNTRKKSR
jgi:superfamily II DNA/RNA helicase